MRLFTILLLIVNTSLAATADGTINMGSKVVSSNGSFDIDVNKGDAVKISNLNTIVISGTPSNNDRTAYDDVCYYVTTSNYSIDFDSINSVGLNKFYLINTVDISKRVPYEILWDDNKNNAIDGSFFKNSDNSIILSSNNKTSVNCNNNTNGRITVVIRNASYNNLSVGLYTDTVILTIKAN